MGKFNQKIAECVGLWLAEGDNKTTREVTFTNNSFELIQFFHEIMKNIFENNGNFRPRLYSYSNQGKITLNLNNVQKREYTDIRARKPYYIYRFASVELHKLWKKRVIETCNNKNYQLDVLRGFFAGEGNVKNGKRSKVLRIAQKNRKIYFEKIFHDLNLKFMFSARGRSYVIWNKSSWDVFANHKLADLHPIKKKQFWNTYNSFQEEHYSKNYLKEKIYDDLLLPKKAINFATKYNRSMVRISEVLGQLKKERLALFFKVNSTCYWVKSSCKVVIISKIKNQYLKVLKEPKTTTDIAKYFSVCFRSANNRLKELERLELVEKRAKLWHKKAPMKKVIVY